MGDKTQRLLLRLVDDPVVTTIQMLRQLPLESAVAYLETISNRADRLGMLSEADCERIADLVRRIALRNIDRAA